jgi:hypothetical protein
VRSLSVVVVMFSVQRGAVTRETEMERGESFTSISLSSFFAFRF